MIPSGLLSRVNCVVRGGFFICAFTAGLLPSSLTADNHVTVTWNASTDPTVVGYNVYGGVASRNYTNVLKLGIASSVTITGLLDGTTYYFAVTSRTGIGVESGYSDEASFTTPGQQRG